MRPRTTTTILAQTLRLIMVALLLAGLFSFASAQRGGRGGRAEKKIEDMTPEEKAERLRQLEQRQKEIQQERERGRGQQQVSGADLEAIITRYERLMEQCAVRKSDRCADVMYTLGALYYDQGRDEFGKASERYSREFAEWDRRGQQGPRPVAPVPDYSKSLQMYWQLTREYPNFNKLPEAFFQMANNYLLAGHLDTTRIIFEQLIQRFPNSPRVSGAHFRLGELAFMDNQYRRAFEHFNKVKMDQVDVVTREMTHYRLGECAYYTGDFDKAVDYFHGYVVACDNNQYQRKEFREMAIEYMVISFSEMPDGVQEAIKFFNRNRGKPYESQVIYGVGRKNRERAQWDAAINALSGALRTYPMYKDAPLARQMLIESYVAKREHEKANAEREALVDDYGQGSKWYEANRSEKVVIDIAGASVRRALGDVATYYLGEAQRRKDRGMYDKSLKRFLEFFRRFPDDKWRVYEYNYYVAEIYNQMGECEKAAQHFTFVAMEDLSTYPSFVQQDLDTLALDPEMLEQLRAQRGGEKSPIAISQEDAGFNTIVSLDNCRKKVMAQDDLDEEKAYALPYTKQIIEHALNFHRRFPQSSNTPEVLEIAGVMHYNGKNFKDAITFFKMVVDQYPDAKNATSAARMLGNSYSGAGQFDLAMQTFKNLLSKTERGTKDFEEIRDLAAGAMYINAENMKKAGNLAGAATAFKAIAADPLFAESPVAYTGWFDAGVCYEEMKDHQQAARTFAELTEKFPRSSLRENAFVRAGLNFKTAEMWQEAAEIYLTAANQIPKAEFAIPSLSAASEMYQKMKDFNMAGKMFELIFERYATDPNTPQALYNAGLVFEMGNHFHDAIKVYELLVKNYPDSEKAAEAFFSIGLCWEKLGEFAKMANLFADYAAKYPNDRFKQLHARVKAGNAFFNMENFRDAETNYSGAIRIFEQHKATQNFNEAHVAEAYYRLGEIAYRKFDGIKLDARNEREMRTRVTQKVEALAEPGKFFQEAAKQGIEEWTMRSLYMIGRGFYDMADAVANQTLFGNEVERMAGKIQVLSSLDAFYDRAMALFGQNITWAKENNISGEYVDSSMQAIMEMAFKKGNILEEVGLLFKNSPIPPGLDAEEREYYEMELEERYLKALDAAMPVYESGMQLAADAGIANSPWLDRIRERLQAINPESEALELKIVQWVPQERPKEIDEHGNEVPARRDAELERGIRSIQNIMGMNIPVDDKISQLNRVKLEAERRIAEEREKINALRSRSGS